VKSLVQQRLARNENGDLDDPFYVADVGEVIRQQAQFSKLLPRVDPFYAVKCNSDPVILKAMTRMQLGFDCASRAEIDSVINLGVDGCRIIYANPCKQASHIRFAAQHGVRMMTFDNEDELFKIKKNHPNPQLVIRVLTDGSKSVCNLGTKFGAHPDNALALLQAAHALGLEVIGVSFHVGSGCFDANAYHDAISRAHKVFQEGASLGFHMSLLDIGGGFPGADNSAGISFPEICQVVRPALEQFFPTGSGVRIIAEPGRFYVSSAFTLATNVHSRRVINANGEGADGDGMNSYMYYINEGLYASLNCIYFDHAVVTPEVLYKHRSQQFLFREDKETSSQILGPKLPCSIWGPTCDSLDCITKDCQLPQLEVGDWIYFDNMGAYTVAASSTFNGFKKCQIIWTNTEADKVLV